jgi:hypothetical protein
MDSAAVASDLEKNKGAFQKNLLPKLPNHQSL